MGKKTKKLSVQGKYNSNCFYDEAISHEESKREIPDELLLYTQIPSVCFGKPAKEFSCSRIVGMSQGEDGNIIVIGGNGSGKSSGVIKPTLITWNSALVVTDIKGEHSKFYQMLYDNRVVSRPPIVYDPTRSDGPSYDLFYFLNHDDPDNLIENLWQIVYAVFPKTSNDFNKFWQESIHNIFIAELLYHYHLGLSFIQTISAILSSNIKDICKKIRDELDETAKLFLGITDDMRDETLAILDRELRNGLSVFTSPQAKKAFMGERDGAKFFTWDMLDSHNIFLCVPENRIEQWGGLINLMYAQLMQYLELRPEKYSPEGADNIQTLIIMDEFARFGKLDYIKNAISTLRSKSVNICLVVQSIAQLDCIYGEHERRIIMDNCQYKAILRANDPETQKMLSSIIGTVVVRKYSISENYDNEYDMGGYSECLSYERDLLVQPHELAFLKDIILLSPYGICRVDKIRLHSNEFNPFYSILNPDNTSENCDAIFFEPPLIIDCKARLLTEEEQQGDWIRVKAEPILTTERRSDCFE